MMKKAMEMQFNWIFILIAGAVILSFFMGVFSWYKATKNSELASEALDSIKATLTSAQASSNTAKILAIPEVPLEFYCEPSTCGDSGCGGSYIHFKGTGIQKETEVEVIFAPDLIESNTLLTWTLPWEAPYKVADFLYLSNPRVRYILVYSEDEPGSLEHATQVDDVMADNNYTTRKLIEAGQIATIKDQNDYLVKFVLFFEPGVETLYVDDSLVESKNWDVLFVPEGDEISGKVMFSKVDKKIVNGRETLQKVPDTSKEYEYLGTPMLLGAVFSENPRLYTCNLHKAFKRLTMVNHLYWKRTELLKQVYDTDVDCRPYYDTATLDAFNTINISFSKEMGMMDFNSAVASMADLADTNGKVLYRDCPRLY